MESARCSRCDAPRENEDNYCRRCGHQFSVALPVVRSANFPVRAKSIPPSLVGSVAVLAAGTGLEWVMRRLARGAASAAGRAVVRQERLPKTAGKAATQPQPEDVEVNELIYVRKVQLRR